MRYPLETFRCVECSGTGKTRAVRLRSRVIEPRTCPHCDGKGEIARDSMEMLRGAVGCFNGCNESFTTRHTVQELLTIYRGVLRCEWDIPPDQWTARQIADLLERGRVPTWDDDDEQPTYDPPNIGIRELKYPLSGVYAVLVDDIEVGSGRLRECDALAEELRGKPAAAETLAHDFRDNGYSYRIVDYYPPHDISALRDRAIARQEGALHYSRSLFDDELWQAQGKRAIGARDRERSQRNAALYYTEAREAYLEYRIALQVNAERFHYLSTEPLHDDTTKRA